MSAGELIARITIWLALSLYAIAEIGRLRWRAGVAESPSVARWISTVGCAFYVVHVVFAFGVFHDWSHAEAYRFTAEQTEQLVGWRWGGGLFVNHLFSAIWITELVAWWTQPQRYRDRSRWIDASVRVFFAFMIINGAVVFVAGPQRWLGVAIVVLLAVGWFVVKPVGRPEPSEVAVDDLLADEQRSRPE